MNKPIPISTPRLRLQEFSDNDWRAVHEYASDVEVVQFSDWGPNSEQQSKDFIVEVKDSAAAKPRTRYTLAIIIEQAGISSLIGACELVVHREHEAGVIGYTLARHFWGQGYATEASAALLRLGFESLGLHRISATTDVRNVASWRVLEKLGMQREAHLKEHLWQRGRWRDSFLYAILDREWRSLNALAE
jgi:ribosomal-protein-alanine N-acetyltransferase